MSCKCSHFSVGRNLRISWSLQCPQPIWLLCEPVETHVPPVNSKAFLGTLPARHPGPLCWAGISRRGWHSEATQCASERFVLAHNTHQTHSHMAVYSLIYKWQNRIINICLLQAHIKHLNTHDPEFHLSLQYLQMSPNIWFYCLFPGLDIYTSCTNQLIDLNLPHRCPYNVPS